MDGQNHNNVVQQQPQLQQPFKFQTQRHQHPLFNQKPPPYQPNYSYQQQQIQQHQQQNQQQYTPRHPNNNQLPLQQHLQQTHQKQYQQQTHQKQYQQQQQHHHQQQQSSDAASRSGFEPCRGSDQLSGSSGLVQPVSKPMVHPIRHDFWARRTAQRASEALRAANNMALPPLNGPSSAKTGPLTQDVVHSAQPQAQAYQSMPQSQKFGVLGEGTSSTPLVTPAGSASLRSATPPGRSLDERERRRRKRRVASDSESGRRSSRSGGGGSGGEGRSGRTRGSRGGAGMEKDIRDSLPTNFRAAISERAPPLPPALLRKLEIKEVNGLGKIRVVLRVSPLVRLLENEAAVLSLDKKRRQVTLTDPLAPPPKDSRFGVSAPKMFAFDQVYSQDDLQGDVVSGAAVDILHAVLAGNDGCILCFGGALLGKSYTMVGLHGSQDQLGVIPSCVAWLYKSIAEQKAKSGARFSVRVSAVAVDATGAKVKDLLVHYSQEGDQSPGSLLREGAPAGGVLSSLSELRAPSPETAAHYLDVALAGRSSLALSSVLQRQQQQQQQQQQMTSPIFPGSATLVYTLHVYQYAVDKNGKGGVVGGRSRLHLIDMGDMSARHGNSSMSLSSLTSVLLAIFNGQKYLPHRDNQLTGVLREALNSLTCHTALVVHVSPAARHAQHSLTTLQLAARVHRTRRKKIRGMNSGSSSGGSSGSRRSSGGETSAGSSSLDFSSSDQSCDTVIYIGGGGPGDSTDGEHPPVFMQHHIRQPRPVGLQRLRSLEQLRAQSASPTPHMRRPASASPTPTSRSVPNGKPFQKRKPCPPPRTVSNNTLNGASIGSNNNNCSSNGSSPRTTPMQAGFIRHQPGVSQIIYPSNIQPLNQQPFMSTFKPFANQTASRQNNNNIPHSKSHEDNLNMVNGNQLSFVNLGSTDKLHNYNAYQEPNNLVPTALSPNQNVSNVQNLRYYQLSQQQLHQQQLFQQHSMLEQQRAIELQKIPPHQPQHQQLASQQQHQSVLQQQQQQQSANAARQPTDSRIEKLDSKSDEQWIDGPRVHKSRVGVARVNKNEQDETWVDGPQVSTQSNGTQVSAATSSGQPGAYGFMDDHKKTMIEKWVEVQTAQVVHQISGKLPTPDKESNKMGVSSSDASGGAGSSANMKSPAEKSSVDETTTLDASTSAKESLPLTHHLTQFRTCDESTNGSDVDTLSEDPSASGAPAVDQPSLIEELERKNLIPSCGGLHSAGSLLEDPPNKEDICLDHILVSSADDATNKVVSDCSTKGRGSPETTSLGGELSIDEVCSQCEALAEECEELSSLLSCEEEECKRQIHQGLATVLEEPELESAVAAEEAHMRAVATLEDTELESNFGGADTDNRSMTGTLRSSRAGDGDGAGEGADDGNDADEESSEIGAIVVRKTNNSPSVTLDAGRSSGVVGMNKVLPASYRRTNNGTSAAGGGGENESSAEGGGNNYRRKCVKRACSSSSTSDRDLVGLKRELSRHSLLSPGSTRSPPEMIEVDLPAYPVVSVDCSTQVCEDDLLSSSLSSGTSKGPVSCSSRGDDHPLRVLSEENLTCASTFTDSYSQMGETGDEDDSDDDDSRPFSLFEGTDYAKIEALGGDGRLGSSGGVVSSDNNNLSELAKIHALYRTLAQQGPGQLNHAGIAGSITCSASNSLQLQPSSLVEIMSNSRDSLVLLEEPKPEAEYESICSESAAVNAADDHSDGESREEVCTRCNKERSVLLVPGGRQHRGGLHWLNNGQSGGDLASLPVDKCTCDIQKDLLPYIPSPLYMFPSLKDSAQSSHSSLIKNRSETSVNLSGYDSTLDTKDADSSMDLVMNDRVPSNGVSVPDFIEDLEANVVLCNPVQYNYSFDKPLTRDERHSDNDSDCVSNISDDSEYMIRSSKLSKFLCVGVGRTKSKTPYKIAKQNFKNESKKNSKMKEGKLKSQSKSRDSSKSPEFSSKNLLKSPSRAALSQNLSKSSSGSSSGGGSTNTGSSWKSGDSSTGGLKGGRWGSKSHSGGALKGGSYCGTSSYGTNSFQYQAAPPATPSTSTTTTTTAAVEGYDSGLDSGITQGSSTPQDIPDSWNLPLEKKQPKGDEGRLHQSQPTGVSGAPPPPSSSAGSKSGTNSSLGTTPSLGESSGYGSMARDSECSSFSSSQDSEMDEEHKKESHKSRAAAAAASSRLLLLPVVQVQKFTEEDILRYEGRSRTAECQQLQQQQQEQHEIAALKARQKQLKVELADAKKNLCVPDKSWAYERKSNFT